MSILSIFSIFSRAAQGAHLSPAERAFLKLLKGIVAAGIVAGLGVLAPLIAGGSFHLTPQVEQAVIGAAATAMLLACEKLFTAKGDAPLPLHQQSAPAPVAAPAASSADGSAI